MTPTTTTQDELMQHYAECDRQLDDVLNGLVWRLCDQMRRTGAQLGKPALVRTRQQVLRDKLNSMKD